MNSIETLSTTLRLPCAPRSLPSHSLPCLLHLRQSKTRLSFSARSRAPPSTIPARDRIIEFGKHKGKMLGAIPSGYLRWVSKNLTSEWSKLAEQVLEDPIYQDRVEWEFADGILSGEKMVGNLNAAEELHAIAVRFGWDFDDKEGWGKVKFPLLGTSQGGRIPRVSDRRSRTSDDAAQAKKKAAAADLAGGERRRDRIERQRTKREIGKLQEKKMELGMEPRISVASAGEKIRPRFARRNGGDAGVAQPPRTRVERTDGEDDRRYLHDRTVERTRNPFPGRDAFLKKVLDRKKPL